MIKFFARNHVHIGLSGPFHAAILFVLVALVATSATAQTTTWTGAVDDNWFNAGNWNNGLPNSAAFTAVVGAPSPTDFTGNNTLGSLSVLSGGILNVSDSDNFNFDGAGSISNAGQINIDFNSDFQIFSTVTNNGTITVLGTGTASDLEMKNATTLAGNGTIFLNGANARISDNAAGATLLTNGASHTIRGNGNVGFNVIAILNNGLITADVAGQTMIVDPAAVDGLTNNGILRAEGGGILRLTTGDYDNTNGTIVSAGGQVQLTGASITGGLITGADIVLPDGSSTSSIADLTTDATIQVGSNLTLDVEGTITNNGTITVMGSTANSIIEMQSATTFAGSGTMILNGPNARIIDSSSGAEIFTNGAGHTIRGNGNIGFNVIGIVNNGLIVADVALGTMTVDPASAGSLTNTGIFRAEGGATLRLNGGDYTISAGTIEAIGANSLVTAVGVTYLGRLGTLRAVDGQILLGDEAFGDTTDSNTVYEFSGTTAYTDIFNDGPNGDFIGLGPGGPGDLRSNFFVDNKGLFRIGDGLDFTSVVFGNARNSGTIVAGAGSTFSMGGVNYGLTECEVLPCEVDLQIREFLPLISTGTLAGSGVIKNTNTPGAPTQPIVDADDIISEGFIKPGDNPGETGTLTLRAQDIFFGDDNVIEIEVGAGVADSLTLITDANPVALNGSLEVSLLSGFAGGSFDIVTAVNGLTGTFDTLTLPTLAGGLEWLVNYGSNALTIESYLPGDFDEDGDVDGRDFLLWQRGSSPSPLSSADLTAWQDNYGIGTSPLVASATAVPEPTGIFLLSLGALSLIARRR